MTILKLDFLESLQKYLLEKLNQTKETKIQLLILLDLIRSQKDSQNKATFILYFYVFILQFFIIISLSEKVSLDYPIL